MSSAPPSESSGAHAPSDAPPRGWTDVRFRAWNLLLLVPLIVIVTPLFDTAEPSPGGLPFFYWFQVAIIPIGIACTVAVHLMTRSSEEEVTADRDVAAGDVDDLDSDISAGGARS